MDRDTSHRRHRNSIFTPSKRHIATTDSSNLAEFSLLYFVFERKEIVTRADTHSNIPANAISGNIDAGKFDLLFS